MNGAGPGIKEAKRGKERTKEDHRLTFGGMKAVVTNGQVTSTPKRKQDGQIMMIQDGIHQTPMRSKNKKVVKRRRTKEKVPKRRKMNVPALGLEKHRLSLTGMPTGKDGTKEKIVERGSMTHGSRRKNNKMLPTGRLINLSTLLELASPVVRRRPRTPWPPVPNVQGVQEGMDQLPKVS